MGCSGHDVKVDSVSVSMKSVLISSPLLGGSISLINLFLAMPHVNFSNPMMCKWRSLISLKVWLWLTAKIKVSC
jgi:hypothetical protein